MVYRRRRYARRRRPIRRRRAVRRRRVTRYNRRAPFPQKVVATLRYVTYVTINPGLGFGLGATYTFRANSVYDPDATGSGHQPRGHDQYMALYGAFRVMRSTIVADFPSQSSWDLRVGCALHQGTTPSDVLDASERRLTNYKNCSHANSDGKYVRIRNSYDGRAFLGAHAFGDNQNTGTVSSNPSEVADFTIFAGSLSSGDDPAAIIVPVTLTYRVQYFDPVSFAQS